MPIEQIPDSDVSYYLVAFDGDGRERTDDPAGLIVLRREGAALVIEGGSEVGRIFGGGISRLAEGPYRTSGVRTHIHLNPTTDPEHTIYSPESTVEVSVALSDEQA